MAFDLIIMFFFVIISFFFHLINYILCHNYDLTKHFFFFFLQVLASDSKRHYVNEVRVRTKSVLPCSIENVHKHL